MARGVAGEVGRPGDVAVEVGDEPRRAQVVAVVEERARGRERPRGLRDAH